MKKMTTTVLCALAAAAFSLSAAAQGEGEDPGDSSSEILGEALEYGELIDWYVDDDNNEYDVYRDTMTGIMWEQPAYLSPKQAWIESRTTTLITPVYVRTNQGEDEKYYYENQGEIVYQGTCGRGCYEWAIHEEGWPQDVDDIYGRGTSGLSDSCDGDFMGDYGYYSAWYEAESEDYTDCYYQLGYPWGSYQYWVYEFGGLNNYDYSALCDEAVRFRYKVDGSSYRTELVFVEVPE